jgi:hypothetical protein
VKLSAILEPLVAAGVDAATILAAVKAWEEQQTDALERRRANDRERQDRRRHVMSRDVTVTVPSRERVTRVEDKPQTTDTQSSEQKITPRAALEAVLDADRAEAVVQHRQRLRKPLTGHAAKLLAGKFAQCPDPNAAADTMIGNGWQGFEPDWLVKPAARGSPTAKSRGVGGVFSDLVEHLENGPGNEDRGQQTAGPTVLSLPYRRAG